MVKSLETIQPVPFGSYQLVERLAMGGMAEVYLARPDGQQRFVALKRILPNIAADDEFIAMFIDEAKIAGQLNHPNVAQIFDLGKINNSYFIAMEYVSGHDLRALWDRTRDAGEDGKTALPIGLACYAVKRICDGLDYAHRRRDAKGRPLGIIHRDVSPQNVLVSYEGDLKIIDFGIAKAANRIVKTQTGILKGKFAYMAPEQARGEPTDHRADIFAIGVILYELLTGERAFKADTDFALLEKVRRVDITPPKTLRPELPKDLERIVFKALSREASDRYAWASALGADLERFMTEQGFPSSKEELGAYLQRTFAEEFQEEQRRLVSYRSLFGDAASGPLASAGAPSRRSEPAGPSAGKAAPVEGTEVGDPLDDSLGTATSFEDGGPTIASLPGGPPRATPPRPTAGPGGALAVAAHAPANAPAASALVASGAMSGGVSTSIPVNGASNGASAQMASGPATSGPIVSGAGGPGASGPAKSPTSRLPAPTTDDTQLDPDSPPESAPNPSPPAVIARDEMPKRVRVVTAKPTTSPSSPPEERSAPRPVERSASIARAAAQHTVKASPAPVIIAAVLGTVIGAGIVGIGWLASARPSATVMFVATPREAEVRLGDALLCRRTPCAVLLEPGRHEVRFRAPGAQELSRVVDVKADGTPPIEVVLERTRDDVRLETSPPGANVTLDDRTLSGTTPLTLPRLIVGKGVRLKLGKEGFEPLEVSRVVDDENVWRYDLPSSTTVWTLSAEPADAFIDGPGRERDGKHVAAVGKKSVPVRFLRPGCEPRVVNIYATGKPEAEQTVALECKARSSGLYIRSAKRLQVLVDGVELPRLAKLDPYPLPAGTWTVMLRGARGKTETHTVELRAGENLTLTTKLK